MSQLNKTYISNKKYFLITFLIINFISTIIGHMLFFQFNFNLNTIIPNILFFDKFFLEYIILMYTVLVLSNKNKITLICITILVFIYLVINFVQLTSLYISGQFLTNLALDNIEFIGLLISVENILIIIKIFIYLIVLPYFITFLIIKYSKNKNYKNRKYFLFFTVSLLLYVFMENIISIQTLQKRNDMYHIHNFSHTAPIYSLYKLIKQQKNFDFNFQDTELKELKKFGFDFNTSKEYPFQKKYFYKKSLFSVPEKPNIIIIFTEGFSSRTSNAYNNTFKQLTPNLKDFSLNEKSMTVHNYFNHTAATYRGLHGQLCSIYPKYGYSGWNIKLEETKNINYICLPHILNKYKYKTIWLNMHYKNASYNDEMVSNFGFQSILSAEDLLKTYSFKKKGLRKDFLTDHESYNLLIEYLKNFKEDKKFMIGMYTVETHAWIDIGKDGIKYQDGKNNGLNTIHNMDDAFGKFWNYFKSSKYYKNTIIIFTSDHCHAFEKSYVQIMKDYNQKDYKKIFVDKIPLIIYNPIYQLPKDIYTHNATSIDLAPTIMQILDINNEKNSFIGTSIFEQKKDHKGFSSYDDYNYVIEGSTIYNIQDKIKLPKRFIQYLHKEELDNKIIKVKN